MSTDDESFHPLGQEWEGELEEMLDDTEYDTDLGMRMAQDAMRVTKGELSEAEFHEKYHEDVMEEFGEDQRPTQEAFEAAQEEAKGTVSRMLSAFDGDSEQSRRDVMKKMGVGAAAVGVGAFGSAADGQPSLAEEGHGDGRHTEAKQNEDLQWGMAIDLERCDGCLSCVQACAEENNLDQGVNWMYVLEYDDPGSVEGGPSLARNGSPDVNRLVRPCQHCTDAPCEKVCPTTARHTRDKDGLVLTDYDVCIGCRYCQVACPYGVNYFQWDEPDVPAEDIEAQAQENGAEGDHMHDDRGRWVDSRSPRGTMSKCTMCPTRQDGFRGDDKVGTTACEDACPPDAIQFGNMKDEADDPKRYAEHPARSRTLARLSVPSADDLEESLQGADSDLESVLEATDIDEEELTLMLAVRITGEELEEATGNLGEYEANVEEALGALSDHGLDLESEEVLVELGLADEPDEDEEFEGADPETAELELQSFAGKPDSNFRLLEDVGTNPNIIYLGNEPGPEAEQREPTGSGLKYEDLDYERADGSEPTLADNRKEILDEGTVGDTGWSL